MKGILDSDIKIYKKHIKFEGQFNDIFPEEENCESTDISCLDIPPTPSIQEHTPHTQHTPHTSHSSHVSKVLQISTTIDTEIIKVIDEMEYQELEGYKEKMIIQVQKILNEKSQK